MVVFGQTPGRTYPVVPFLRCTVILVCRIIIIVDSLIFLLFFSDFASVEFLDVMYHRYLSQQQQQQQEQHEEYCTNTKQQQQQQQQRGVECEQLEPLLSM